MATTVGRMTERQLREIVETSIERKLLEIIGDPDEGLSLRRTLRRRLLRQKRAVSLGERGIPLDDVARKLDL